MMASDVLLVDSVKPRAFLDSWSHLIDADPSKTRLYKGAENRLLAEVLNVREKTVNSWGPAWEKMPPQYEQTLAMADTVRRTIEAAQDSPIFDLLIKRLYQNPE